MPLPSLAGLWAWNAHAHQDLAYACRGLLIAPALLPSLTGKHLMCMKQLNPNLVVKQASIARCNAPAHLWGDYNMRSASDLAIPRMCTEQTTMD